jgi:hypothetical protein
MIVIGNLFLGGLARRIHLADWTGIVMVDFGLTYRMKNRNLLDELRGKVSSGSSGWSRWRVQQYLYSGPPQHGYAFELIDSYKKNNMLCMDSTLCTNAVNHIDNWKHNWQFNKCVTHEVIAVDTTNRYAIIQHNLYQASICDVCHSTHVSSLSCPNPDEIYYNPVYFLCGINNNDKLYFLRPLLDVHEGLIIRAKAHGDVMSIVKWCNKEDLGFEGRIQGDIIFAEIEPRLSKIISIGRSHSRSNTLNSPSKYNPFGLSLLGFYH